MKVYLVWNELEFDYGFELTAHSTKVEKIFSTKELAEMYLKNTKNKFDNVKELVFEEYWIEEREVLNTF